MEEEEEVLRAFSESGQFVRPLRRREGGRRGSGIEEGNSRVGVVVDVVGRKWM